MFSVNVHESFFSSWSPLKKITYSFLIYAAFLAKSGLLQAAAINFRCFSDLEGAGFTK